jgi:hypothetical protein
MTEEKIKELTKCFENIEATIEKIQDILKESSIEDQEVLLKVASLVSANYILADALQKVLFQNR